MKQKTRILIYILTVSIILIAGVIIILASHDNKPEEKVDSHSYVDQGNLYLIKLSYDKAAIEYTEAIKIDPMNAEAYIGLATVYEKTGDEDKALDILREGYEKTNDNSIKEKLDGLENKQRMAETMPIFTSPPLPEPIKVPDFFGLDKATAESIADEMGISVVFAEEENERIPKGYVIKQDIQPETEVEDNTEIQLTISLGVIKAEPLPVLEFENREIYDMTYEELFHTFIRAFQRKDTAKMADIDGNTDPKGLDFVNGIEFEEYTVEMISDTEAHVELNILKSNDSRFPVGKSIWYMYYGDGMYTFLDFYNVDTQRIELNYLDRLYNIVEFSTYTSNYNIPENADKNNLKEYVINDTNEYLMFHEFYHLILDSMIEGDGASKKELNEAWMRFYEIDTKISETNFELLQETIRYDKKTDLYFQKCAHDGSAIPHYIINSIKEENGHVYIDLTSCADIACLVIEHRYIYDYTDNGDYFTLNSITEY